jgi:hypothetical protein
MADITRKAGDFSLTIEGVEYPFLVLIDQQGLKQWNDGLAPMVSPQFNTGGFSYQNIPPEIEVIEAFEDFSGGAGFEHEPSGSVFTKRTRYNYAQGLDLSYGRAMPALKRVAVLESDGTAIGAAPTKFFHSPLLGLYMIAGAYIYKWDLASTSWVEKDNATATFSGVSYTDILEINGKLVALRGTTADYKTSTDGTTWTAFTAEDENGDFAVLRGNSSDIAAIWKININVVKANTAPAASGWAGSDQAGNTSETVRGAAVVDNTMYFFKDTGVYSYDGVNINDLMHTTYVDSYNGKNPYVWRDGKVYFPWERRLRQWNPYGDTEDPSGVAYPRPGMSSNELLGPITAISGDANWLYIAVKNRAGNTYIMRGNETAGNWVWHNWKYLGANDCNALSVVGPGILHATNPAVVFGYGTAGHYVVLPQQDLLPTEDPACRFEVAEGTCYFPYVDFGATYEKFLNRGSVLGYGLSGGRYATLSYEIDRNGTVTSLVSATEPPLTETATSTEVTFLLVRPVLKMATGDDQATATVDGISFGATLNPERKQTWSPVVILSDGAMTRDGVDTENWASAAVMRRILFGSVRRRMTLSDRDSNEHTVRLLDIKGVAMKDKNDGDHEYESSAYQLSLVEIDTLTSDEEVGIYDDVSYDTNVVEGAS